ncbi:MAG: hypothetical protein KF857_01840 [Fimbriimonadaceae bacterium]|nr:hypothetical protein [Fimbriimonadaceae bacterium]
MNEGGAPNLAKTLDSLRRLEARILSAIEAAEGGPPGEEGGGEDRRTLGTAPWSPARSEGPIDISA